MIPDLATLTNTQLYMLDRDLTLALKFEIGRASRKDPRFRQTLKDALAVDEELEKRLGADPP